jgi:hypothetical protein
VASKVYKINILRLLLVLAYVPRYLYRRFEFVYSYHEQMVPRLPCKKERVKPLYGFTIERRTAERQTTEHRTTIHRML